MAEDGYLEDIAESRRKRPRVDGDRPLVVALQLGGLKFSVAYVRWLPVDYDDELAQHRAAQSKVMRRCSHVLEYRVREASLLNLLVCAVRTVPDVVYSGISTAQTPNHQKILFLAFAFGWFPC